jgi:hypothetical protein
MTQWINGAMDQFSFVNPAIVPRRRKNSQKKALTLSEHGNTLATVLLKTVCYRLVLEGKPPL